MTHLQHHTSIASHDQMPDQTLEKRSFHYSFRDFLESGGDEATSPFLLPKSRPIARWLQLPLALSSAALLATAWSLSLLGVDPLLVLSLVACVYFLSGTRAVYQALDDLLQMQINIDVLMTLAAYLCLITDSALEGALLLVLFDISRNMERMVSRKARGSLMSLRSVAPEKAWIILKTRADGPHSDDPRLDDPQQLRHIEDIPPGSFIVVKAGEIVPLDGLIIEGSSSVSLSHLTGEPIPRRLEKGHEIPSGARTLDSPLLLKVLRPAQEATLTRIIRLVHEAQESKPNLQRFFDDLADNYAKGVIFSSFLIAAALPLLTSLPYLGLEGSIYRALGFMIAASPCALILAVPIAYLSALGSCAKHGIVLKSGAILDLMASCRQIAFDKTGTLTLGQPLVESVQTFSQAGSSLASLGQTSINQLARGSESHLLAACRALERQASHPLALAILTHLEPLSLPSIVISSIQLHSGFGMSAQSPLGEVRLGQSDWALEIVGDSAASASWRFPLQEKLKELKQRSAAHSLACYAGGAALFIFHDQLRPGVAQTLTLLSKEMGFKTYMLTGDHELSALNIAKQAGIDEVYHSLKPEDKLKWIRKLGEKSPLAMIGDGINDAPALAGASVGIAMGGIGSAAATAAASVLLLHDELALMPWLFTKARQTRRIIWQNLLLAASVIVIASLSALSGWIPLWAAVIAHEGGTILVALNGLRLLQKGHSIQNFKVAP